MRIALVFLLALSLTACVTTIPRQIPGGTRIVQPGVTLSLPTSRSWLARAMNKGGMAFGAKGDSPQETLVIAVARYPIPEFYNAVAFLGYVKAERAKDIDPHWFETIQNQERLYTERSEICVKHEAASKELIPKRGAAYTMLEYYGMNCIHPFNTSVGIFVEFSRKAPPGVDFPPFETIGKAFLQSVEFIEIL